MSAGLRDDDCADVLDRGRIVLKRGDGGLHCLVQTLEMQYRQSGKFRDFDEV